MIILVHGAYHGAWCWVPLLDCLNDAGVEAHASDLPGHGTAEGWISDQTMTNYIEAVVRQIDEMDKPVTLVGHSMGGAIVAACAEARPDKVERAVFLAAYIPANDETVGELVKADEASFVGAERIDVAGNDAVSLKTGTLSDAFYSGATPKQLAWAEDRVQLQGFEPFTHKFTLSDKEFGSVSKSAIICTEDRAISPSHQRWMAERAGCDPIIDLASDHSPFVTNANALAEILGRFL